MRSLLWWAGLIYGRSPPLIITMQLDAHPELVPWNTPLRDSDGDPDSIVNTSREPSIVSDYSEIMNRASSTGYSVFNINQFCQCLRHSPKALNGSISSVELYCETIGVRHRYLILRVQRGSGRDLYIRLDRRRDDKQSIVNFALGFSTSDASDGVSY